ncbi:MAG TPA: transposase [Candidatus Saccharimonadia bacterium]|nr:transposase [Candidatus Saccharimonadia bacterium]
MRFGIQALTLKPFASLASNARQTVSNPDTASTKMDRLARNSGLAEALSTATMSLGFIRPSSIVACDHSDFNGLMAFVGAVQTHRGRAIPCLVETTYSPRLPARGDDIPIRKRKLRQAYRQQGYNLYDQAEMALEDFADKLGFWPRLVFDRGFGGKHFVHTLMRHKAIFYIRLKARRFVDFGVEHVRVSELTSLDEQVQLDGMKLRIVRSDDPETGEPWYILTSDMGSRRQKIVRIYYRRFEIEETFKDLKHILDLDQSKLNRPLSLKVVLWFTSLSVILSFLVGWWTRKPDKTRHTKKTLSWFRQFFEALEREMLQPACQVITGG